MSRILVVDDDQNLLASMKRQLRRKYDVETAQGGEEALKLIQSAGPFSVVLCDMRMPGMDGIQTLRKIREKAPQTVRMMLTGNADQKTAIDAINQGSIFRFFTKPCEQEVLEEGLNDGLEQHRLIVAERELLEKTLSGSVRMLTDMLSLTAPQAYGEGARLREWVRMLTREFSMPFRWQLELAAMLSPIGLLTVPPEVLVKRKEGKPLNKDEQRVFDRAPESARKLIANIPRLAQVAEIVYLQDRGFDGSGFPIDGPRGTDIPVDARILALLKGLASTTSDAVPSIQSFDALEPHYKRYDPQLFTMLRECFKSRPGSAGEGKLLTITLDLLLPGYRLAENMVFEDGRMALSKETTLTDAMIERLRNVNAVSPIREPIQVIRPPAEEIQGPPTEGSESASVKAFRPF